jgi:hypothetical protein
LRRRKIGAHVAASGSTAARPDLLRDETGILQRAEADRNVDVFRDRIEERVREVKIDLNLRIVVRKRRHERAKRFLFKYQRAGDAQECGGLFPRVGDHALRVVQRDRNALVRVQPNRCGRNRWCGVLAHVDQRSR